AAGRPAVGDAAAPLLRLRGLPARVAGPDRPRRRGPLPRPRGRLPAGDALLRRPRPRIAPRDQRGRPRRLLLRGGATPRPARRRTALPRRRRGARPRSVAVPHLGAGRL